MAKRQAPKKAPLKRAPSSKKSSGSGNLRTRAFGDAADGFGKEVAPLGPRAGVLARRVGGHLLTMLEGSVYGFEQVGSWLNDAVTEKLRGINPGRIVDPDPRIAVPAVQALVYSMDSSIIREMFAALLAANMDTHTRGETHPAFVEFIKEMTELDAKVLERFRGDTDQDHIIYSARALSFNVFDEIGVELSLSVDGASVEQLLRATNNLERLGLLQSSFDQFPLLDGYDPSLGKDKQERDMEQRYGAIIQTVNSDPASYSVVKVPRPVELQIVKRSLMKTPLGVSFIKICLT